MYLKTKEIEINNINLLLNNKKEWKNIKKDKFVLFNLTLNNNIDAVYKIIENSIYKQNQLEYTDNNNKNFLHYLCINNGINKLFPVLGKIKIKQLIKLSTQVGLDDNLPITQTVINSNVEAFSYLLPYCIEKTLESTKLLENILNINNDNEIDLQICINYFHFLDFNKLEITDKIIELIINTDNYWIFLNYKNITKKIFKKKRMKKKINNKTVWEYLFSNLEDDYYMKNLLYKNCIPDNVVNSYLDYIIIHVDNINDFNYNNDNINKNNLVYLKSSYDDNLPLLMSHIKFKPLQYSAIISFIVNNFPTEYRNVLSIIDNCGNNLFMFSVIHCIELAHLIIDIYSPYIGINYFFKLNNQQGDFVKLNLSYSALFDVTDSEFKNIILKYYSGEKLIFNEIVALKYRLNKKEFNDENQCYICYDEISSIKYNCGHKIGLNCSEQKECPFCRQKVTERSFIIDLY